MRNQNSANTAVAASTTAGDTHTQSQRQLAPTTPKSLIPKNLQQHNRLKTILYIHGFNSSGNAVKAQKLIQYLPECKIVSPNLDYYNATPHELIEQVKGIIRDNNVDMIVGTSLGGMLTMYMSAICDIKALAINPASQPNNTLQQFVGIELTNFATNETHILKQEAFDAYQEFVNNEFPKAKFSKRNLRFALSKDDELLGSYENLIKQFDGFDIYEFSSVTHRFKKFEYLIPIIRDILGIEMIKEFEHFAV